MKTATFKQTWLDAISFLSVSMQNRIILIVTRYQLTGVLPEKMSKTILCAVRFILLDLGVDIAAIPALNPSKPSMAGTSRFAEARHHQPLTPTTSLSKPSEPSKCSESSGHSAPTRSTKTPSTTKLRLDTPKGTRLPRKQKKALKKLILARQSAA